MNLTILRHEYITGKRTLGSLYPTPDDPLMPINPDGLPPVCYTMEPKHDLTLANVPRSDTAILAGEYPYYLRNHSKYKMPIFEILKTGKRIGIQLHTGVRDDDTFGCIMPGTQIINTPDGRVIAASQAAMKKLLLTVTGEKSIEEIKRKIDADKIYRGILTIKDKSTT